MRRWSIAVGLVVGAVAAVLPASVAAAAAPTCTPAAPAVVGSGADRLTITVPGCATEAGVTGYRIQVLATATEDASQIDVPLGTTQRTVTGLSAGTLYRFRLAATNADGAGPWSPRSGDAVPPFTSTAAFVDRQARDFTAAAPLASEKAVWLEQLGSGGNVATDVVAAYEQSAYWQKQSPVIRLFQAYFLRLPDKSGLAYWTNKSRNGTKLSAISQSFASSSEFTRRYGTLTNRAFVEKIYENVLGRPGERSGIDYWTGKLDAKTKNRGEVMVGFSESSEYKRKTEAVVWTVNLFTGMLLRLPTKTEVDTWTSQTKVALIDDLLGSSAYAARVAVAAPGAAPGITTTSLPAGRVGTAYGATLAATGGAGGTTWSKPSGSLPAGLSLSSGGTISGTPTATGTSTFAVKATDAAGRATQRNLSITVTSFSITTGSLPTGVISAPYSTTLAATGGTGSLTWSLESGTLPAGLALSTSGVLSGTPTVGGTRNLTFKVTDGAGASATKALSLTISTFGITTTSLPNGTVGQDYSAALAAVGGSGTLSWSVGPGFPDGLSLMADGTILGQPYKGGTFTFTITVEDGTGAQRSRQYTITVPALVVSTTTLPGGVITSPYLAKLTAANGYASLTWTVQSGSLPAGLSLASDGTISGTPTTGGTSTFTVKVADQYTSTATRSLSITVSSFAILTVGLPGGYTGIPYVAALEAAGGSGSTWSVTAGALPAGLALDGSTGVITGTPTGSGSSTFTVRVDAAGGKTASRSFTVAIGAVADWPQNGHDGGRSGWNPGDGAIDASNVSGLREEWSAEVTAQPVIVGSALYAAGSVPGRGGSAVYSLDLLSGDLLWSGPPLVGTCGSGPVAVTSTAVILSCNGLHAYSRTGDHGLLWSTADTDPGIVPNEFLLSGTTAIGWTGTAVYAYRASDGQRLWTQGLPSGATNINAVAASATNVVVAYTDRVRSLNIASGAQQWSKTSSATPGSVMIGGSSAYVIAGGGMQQYALSNGALGWSLPATTALFQPIGVDGDTVYAFEASFSELGQGESNVRAFDATDGSSRWKQPIGTRIANSAITKDLLWVQESQIYAWGRYSALIAYRKADGTELKRIEFADNAYGPSAWGNGHVAISQGGSFGGPDPARLRVYGFAPAQPSITSTMVPTGRIGTAYDASLEAAGGSGALTWSVSAGTLPTGLALAPDGTLSGTPSAAGAARVTVKVTDAKGRSRSRGLTVTVLAAAGASTWSGHGRTIARDGANPNETAISRDVAAQIASRWKTLTPTGTEQSPSYYRQPVVVGSLVIDVDKQGRLAAYSTAGTTANRAPVWTRDPQGSATYLDSPAESGGTLYALDQSDHLDAIRATDGVRLWQVNVASRADSQARPLVVGGKVLLFNSQGDVVAYNTADGSPAWSGAAVDLVNDYFGSSMELASDGTRAFVLSHCELKAITVATGAIQWSVSVTAAPTTNCGVPALLSPMVADGAVFAGTYEGSIAVEAATGSVRWRSGTAAGYGNGAGVIANGAWVLSNGASDQGSMIALDLKTGDILWRTKSALAGGWLATAGDLLVSRNTYSMRAYDLLTGEELADLGTPDPSTYTTGAPTIAAGRIFITTRDGIRAFGPL